MANQSSFKQCKVYFMWILSVCRQVKHHGMYIANHQAQLSLLFLGGQRIKHQLSWLGLRWSTFICVTC